MKRMTILTGLVSVMMLGASVSAHADHERGKRQHGEKHESHRAKAHKHSNGAYCNVDHGGHYRDVVVEPSVCQIATEERSKLRRMRSRKIHLQQQYEYELDRYGWRVARETYYKLQRVQQRLRHKRIHVRNLETQCEIAKQRQYRDYRYGWSDGYYRYRYNARYSYY